MLVATRKSDLPNSEGTPMIINSQWVVFGFPSVKGKVAICAADKILALFVGARIPAGFHHLHDNTRQPREEIN